MSCYNPSQIVKTEICCSGSGIETNEVTYYLELNLVFIDTSKVCLKYKKIENDGEKTDEKLRQEIICFQDYEKEIAKKYNLIHKDDL